MWLYRSGNAGTLKVAEVLLALAFATHIAVILAAIAEGLTGGIALAGVRSIIYTAISFTALNGVFQFTEVSSIVAACACNQAVCFTGAAAFRDLTADSLTGLGVYGWAADFLYVSTAGLFSRAVLFARTTGWCCSTAKAIAAIGRNNLAYTAGFAGILAAISETNAVDVTPASSWRNSVAEADTRVPRVNLTQLNSVRTTISFDEAVRLAGTGDVAYCNLRSTLTFASQFRRRWLTGSAQVANVCAAVATLNAS